MKRSIIFPQGFAAGWSVGIVAVSLAILQADPVTVDLQSKTSGYEEGSLNGQNGWVVRVQAPANGDFRVTPGTGMQVVANTGGTHAAAYAFVGDKEATAGHDTFPAGLPTSVSVNFVLKQSQAAAKAAILAVGWGIYLPVGPNNLPFSALFARDSEKGGYLLRLHKQSDKTNVTGETSIVIPETALGFNDKGESAPLQLSFTLTNDGGPRDWTSISMLTNLVTKQVFVLKNIIVAPEVYKTDNLVRTIVNYRRGEDGLDYVVLTQIDGEVIPEPTSQ